MGDSPVSKPPEVFLDLCDTLTNENRLYMLASQYEDATLSSKALNDVDGTPNDVNSFLDERGILMNRALPNFLRTQELFMARLFASIFPGVLIGTLFYYTDDNQEGLGFCLSYMIFTIAS
ncbi:hypothetical protein EON65_07655 [archaeon]|nr:MAG: hypothetical protein EON65_07655 [archaeon]